MPISGRAAALMARLAQRRYRTERDARAFAQAHLGGELDLAKWVEGYEGHVAGVIDSINDLHIVSRQVGGYATPERIERVRDLDLHLMAEALLRDFDVRFSSLPEDADRDDRVEELRRELIRELALSGYEWDEEQGRLRTQAPELQSAEQAKSVLETILERTRLPQAAEIWNRVNKATDEYRAGNFKDVGKELRLALDELLEGIVATAIRERGEDRSVRSKERDWSASLKYLQDRGVLGAPELPGDANEIVAERAFLAGIHRFLSVHGTHIGLTAPADALAALTIGLATAMYLAQKFTDWSRRGFQDYRY